MQVLPFVFSLILVFFFLTSRLASEERLDKKILSSCFMVHKNRLDLIKRGELYNVFSLKQPPERKKTNEQDKKKSTHRQLRPQGSYGDYHKFSLAFFLKKTDQLTFQFAKHKLFTVLKACYGEKLSLELYDEMIHSFLQQKPQKVCNLELKTPVLKEQFFSLLTDKKYPLEDVLVTEVFKDNALCYFFFLNIDFFQKLFPSQEIKTYLADEYKQRCELKSFVLVKEKVLPQLMNLCPDWENIYFDQLICFQSVRKKQIKPVIKDQKNEFFYCPTIEVNER